MLLSTFTALAQEESQSISQNQRLSITKRMERGEYVDSNAPYGYRLINKQLEPYEPEAKVVKVSADVLLFDSLENTVSVSNHEFAAVLSDCTEYETRILLDVVRSAKKSMRENKRLIRGRHN